MQLEADGRRLAYTTPLVFVSNNPGAMHLFRFGMRTQLVSVHSGAIVWAVDALYDAADRSTISDLRHYYEHMEADDHSLHGWELNLIAPSWFARYVAHRFVGTWTDG